MIDRKVQLSQMLEISSHGHILYIYDAMESYIENAVSYILSGIEHGNHLLLIDNKIMYERIYTCLQGLITEEKLKYIHYVNNYEYYHSNGDFHFESIINHLNEVFKPLDDKNISVRTWAHVEWEEQNQNLSKISRFENKADQFVNSSELISVCAYDGNRIPATFQIKLLRNHEFFMTDKELVKSNLYKKSSMTYPSLSLQENHKKIENQLKATQDQLKSFIMQNLDPIIIHDMDDKVIAVNPAFEKTFGWSAQEVLGLHAVDLPVIPDDRKFEVNRNISFTHLGDKIIGYETLRKTKDGRSLNIMLSGFPLLNENQKLNGRAVIIRDITDKKQAQELLIRTEKLSIAGELAAGIAHEIRNPVTSVKGFLQLLQSGSEDTSAYYEIMASEIQRIELILNELLMLAKPQAIQFERVNISFLIKDVATLLDAQANLNNVQIITEIESDEIYLNCEKNQIKQVCINFIKNAIEAMENGGKLIIQTENINNESFLIRFMDEGCGIPEHLLSKLGLPFWTTKEKGTGLGFMVSKKIIENHNGTVSISSVENKGTTIEVCLPL
jgi:PAS domain S-box-containing protein